MSQWLYFVGFQLETINIIKNNQMNCLIAIEKINHEVYLVNWE